MILRVQARHVSFSVADVTALAEPGRTVEGE
jgi:hypothetical protein